MTDKDVEDIRDAIERFSENDTILLTPAFMRCHEQKWVATYAGGVVAVSGDMHGLFQTLAEIGAPLARTAVRYIGKDGISA